VDSDLFGEDANYSAAWIENSWFQTAEAIDCSSLESVSISIETRYRCWDNGSSDDSEKCLIEISRDGVNWPDISTFAEVDGTVDYGDGVLVASRWEVFPGYETGSESDNPSLVEFDITSAAGGESVVYVRFRWSGTWGYSWEIDDISIYETPANDIRIDNYVSYTDYNTTFIYECGVFAEGQLTSLEAAAKVYNWGYLDQSGTMMMLNVNGNDVGISDPVTLAYQSVDTLRVPFDMSAVGTYDLTYTVAADNEDENPSNNVASQSFEVSSLHYGRDNGTMTGVFPGDGTDDFIALNPYQIFEDVTIYAIDVAIVAGSENGTPVIAHLFDGLDDNFITEQYGGLMVSSAELDLAADYTNDGTEDDIVWYTLVLEEPYEAAGGSFIAAGFEHYGGASVQVWESQYAYDNTCFVYGPFGSGSAYDWYYTNEVPMVRLNLDPNAVNTVSGGCMDPLACNYNPSATSDDGSCTYPGCMDPLATNYDSSAGCSAECIYLTYDCASIGQSGWADESIGLYPEWQDAMHGVSWEGEWVFNIPSMIEEPSSGVEYAVHHIDWTAVNGLPDWVDEAEFILGELGGASQHCIQAVGTPTAPSMYDISAVGEVFISIFGQPFSIGIQTYTAILEVVGNPNPIPGCMYSNAVNYTSYSTEDDGSCLFAGCTDPDSADFNPIATIDDGSCGEGCDPDANTTCTSDNNGDGVVNVSDLLILLGEFGGNCE
jgi:hypothetical protein